MLFEEFLEEVEGNGITRQSHCGTSYTVVSVIGGEMSVTLEDIFIFITGAEREPPLGLDHRMKLSFSRRGVLPTASTCTLSLTLPSSLCREKFFTNMAEGFKSHGIFGHV